MSQPIVQTFLLHLCVRVWSALEMKEFDVDVVIDSDLRSDWS